MQGSDTFLFHKNIGQKSLMVASLVGALLGATPALGYAAESPGVSAEPAAEQSMATSIAEPTVELTMESAANLAVSSVVEGQEGLMKADEVQQPVDPAPHYDPGWSVIDGKKYYADANGILVSGWIEDLGKRYYFDPLDGNAMVTGLVTVQDKAYYLASNGELFSAGWILVEETWYYASQVGELVTGWLSYGGAWYYLDPVTNGAMLTGSFKVDSTLYHAYSSGVLVTGNGWMQVDGLWYWGSPSGALYTGWLSDGSFWYWLDPTTGAMATGWFSDGLHWYLADGSGRMQANRWILDNARWYWLEPNGAMVTGWHSDGYNWYWLDPATGIMVTGWYSDGSARYFSDTSGAMLSNGWLCQEGNWYCLNSSGSMRTGWLSYSGSWYWLDLDSGVMAVGNRAIGGERYFFLNGGAMAYSQWIAQDDGTCSFLGASGNAVFDGAYDASGRIVLADGKSGWATIDGLSLYFDPANGGALSIGWFVAEGVSYYANASGVMQYGWVNSDGVWYYLNPSSGAKQTGWVYTGNAWYYLQPSSGAMQTGWIADDGEWYYLRGSGAMVANSSVMVSDGTCWYMNGSGRHDRQAAIDILIDTARSLLGVPYVWLGLYPENGGMDCASFTWHLYQQLGIDIGFETYDQMNSGVRVYDGGQPGDIILMYYGGWPNYNSFLPEHVVLYAGSGMIYEEPTFGGHCQYVSLGSKGAYDATTRRILS